MIIIYGFKILDVDQIKELIILLGLTDFTTDKEQGMLNNPTINQIVDFVYYECLPFVPFQVLEAFTHQNKLAFFRKSVTDHLYITIRMRMDFENKLANSDGISLYQLMRDQGQYSEEGKHYLQLSEINACYGNNYFKPTKRTGDKRSDPYLFPSFQENLFARTIKYRTINPLYSQKPANYINVRKLVTILNKSVTEGFAGTVSQYLIESNYNFNLLKHITSYVEGTPIQNIDFIKLMGLFGLLPNVFSRNEYIKVLLTYNESYAPNLLDFANLYFQQIQYENKGVVQSSRDKNKSVWRNQYEVKGILGNRFLKEYNEYRQTEATQYMTTSLYMLSQFTFPLMEMYTYYLLKQVYPTDVPYNSFSFPITDHDDQLSLKQQDIFNLFAPIMYKIKSKSLQFKTQFPVSKEHAKSWVSTATNIGHIPLPEEFRIEPLLSGIFNANIISKKLVEHCEDEINPVFLKEITSEPLLRSLDGVRNAMKN